jgi:hypothetical protein
MPGTIKPSHQKLLANYMPESIQTRNLPTLSLKSAAITVDTPPSEEWLLWRSGA